MKLATWNIKQAVAPKKPLPQLWQYAEQVIDADVIVFTEAKVPKEGLPAGWTAVWKTDGIGERRRWGTVIAARNGYELVDVTNGVSGARWVFHNAYLARHGCDYRCHQGW